MFASKPIFYLFSNIYDGVNELVEIVDSSKLSYAKHV